MAFVTKDDPVKDTFETGMNRGSNDGKPRFDLIPLWILNILQWWYSGVWYRPDTKSVYAPWEDPEKADLTLIDPIAMHRLAALLERGARKYGRDNWQKGAPLSRQFASIMRHLLAWAFGDRSEDHLAAVLFGAMTLMRFEYNVFYSILPKHYADMGPMKNEIHDQAA